MWVKICGITRLEDAVSAARFGADAVGFVFGEGPGRVTPERAREIARRMPGRVARVGVFEISGAGPRAGGPGPGGGRGMEDLVEYCLLDMLQLPCVEGLEAPVPPDRVIRTLEVHDCADLLRAARTECGAVMLQGYGVEPEAGGERMDWRMVRAIKPGRVILSGGLHPGNVAGAVREVGPYGVDARAGVESRPGVKDAVLMYRFIESARRADYELKEAG